MGLLTKLLLLPVTGPIDGLMFITKQVRDAAEAEYLDEGRVQADLIALNMERDMEEISDEEFEERESQLLEHLEAIYLYKRELMEQEIPDEMVIDADMYDEEEIL